MRKVFIPVMAALALSFAACGGAGNPPADTAAVEDSIVLDDNADMTLTLASKIANNDTIGFGEVAALIQNKIKELYAKGDTAAAQAYIEKVETFVEENKEKLQELDQQSTLCNMVEQVKNLPTELKEGAEQAASDVKTGVKQAAESATSQAEQKVEAAKAAAAKAATSAREDVERKANQATQKVGEVIEETDAAAKKKAEEAKERARERLGL